MVYEECATSVYCVHKVACFRKDIHTTVHIQPTGKCRWLPFLGEGHVEEDATVEMRREEEERLVSKLQ